MREIVLNDGRYETPSIGERNGDYPESSFVVKDGKIAVDSALYGEVLEIDKVFKDPRAANYVDAVVRHQLHHLDTRQLSVPEAFETRAGAGRMNRLTTIVESAAMGALIGATYEQTVQVMDSDINDTVDSHRLGDHLQGDYLTQSIRDDEILPYKNKSGLTEYLVERNALQPDGYLVGSPVHISELTNPNRPRRYDINECKRPDGNLDRTPFTFYEGLYLVPQSEIISAAKSIHRAEVRVGDSVEERLASNSIEAGRLGFILSVRHLAEHWGEPMHHAIEEFVSVADRSRFSTEPNLFTDIQEYNPIDYLRTSESKWYKDGDIDPFVINTKNVAANLAKAVREAMAEIQAGNKVYSGPIDGVKGLSIVPSSNRTKANLSVDIGKYDATGELWIALPAHKYREPMDLWVSTPTGLKRTTEIDPSLKDYAQKRLQWLGSYLAKVTLPRSVIKELAYGINQVNKTWMTRAAQRSDKHPLKRDPMPAEVMAARIDEARNTTMQLAFRQAA